MTNQNMWCQTRGLVWSAEDVPENLLATETAFVIDGFVPGAFVEDLKETELIYKVFKEKSCTARIQHWPFCVVVFTCWPAIYNPAFQSLFLICNGLLFIIWLSIFAL